MAGQAAEGTKVFGRVHPTLGGLKRISVQDTRLQVEYWVGILVISCVHCENYHNLLIGYIIIVRFMPCTWDLPGTPGSRERVCLSLAPAVAVCVNLFFCCSSMRFVCHADQPLIFPKTSQPLFSLALRPTHFPAPDKKPRVPEGRKIIFLP